MPQTTLSVVLEVAPESARPLLKIIEQVSGAEETWRPGDTELYSRLKWGVPSLHFMSMSVFHGADYDPIFVIEVNFDGPPGPFWAQLEATLGPNLRLMLRCCKRPADSSGPLYDAVTKTGTSYPVAPYLERKTLTPSVFHHGNRGLERARILNDADLFLATRTELAQADPTIPNPYRGITAQAIHKKLRAALLSKFPWLDTPAPARISPAERLVDLLKFSAYVFVALFCLSIPGLALAAIMTPWKFIILFGCAALLVGAFLWRIKAPRAGEGAPTRSGGLTVKSLSSENKLLSPANPWGLVFWVAVFLVAYVAVASAAIFVVSVPLSFAAALITGTVISDQLGSIICSVVLGLCSLAFTIPALVLWLRVLERRDSSQDAPPVDLRELRKMTHREDWIPQNHMGSVVLVKPGVLRMALFRAGHRGLGLLLRVQATDGYLGSMRTIHFAHWAFVNNSSRLMFFSNFDNSWDSYLDDFIEKAHGGLTLAWGSGVGFPPTRFLVLDGASHGRQFKAWARHSMAVSRFWFSAYKDLTVNQIERNARIADGLRKRTLTAKEADAWARDL
ncbi:MAG: hypothetical protein WB756_06735 [Xanthobacteraceae bacterium]